MGKTRFFLPGSNWIYYKIFLNPNSGNHVLLQHIVPALHKLAKDEDLKWFFIRYNTPSEHLRVRIRCNEKNRSLYISSLESVFSTLLSQNIIYDIELGTYHREIERYGQDNIDLCETLFIQETEIITNILGESPSDEKLFLTALGFTLNYLTLLVKDPALMKHIVDRQFHSFSAEFNTMGEDFGVLNELYNNNFDKINSLLNFYPYQTLNTELSGLLSKLGKPRNQRTKGLTRSIIHMMINRFFYSEQRKAEMVIYHHLSLFLKKHQYAK